MSLMVFVLMVVLFAVIDFGRAIHLKQILINVSREGANLSSRGTDPTNTLNAVVISAQPLSINQSGYIIISKVYRDGTGHATVAEQYRRGGVSASSRIGLVGGTPNLPNSSIPPNNQNLWIVEVFYEYHPITPLGHFLSFALPSPFYDVAYF
jgi:hypothetical protein